MPDKELPARPDLEQYRKQAKELARTCRNGDPDALLRIARHQPQHTTGTRIALSDAQFVLAREHGFESWPKFAAHIEQLRIARAIADLADPVNAFLRGALVPREGSHNDGTLEEANAILARYPQVASANIYTAAVLGDESAIRAFIAKDSAFATHSGGPYGWDALSHLCFSRYLREDTAEPSRFVAAARALLEAGADANTGWYEKPYRESDPPVWESVLYGAAGSAHHAGLTRLLLEHGADPNDGETPYHVPESYDNTVMRILLESEKVDTKGKAWMLARKADWHDIEGVRLALEYGCDPNFIPHWGRSALQHAVQRDNHIDIIRLMLDHGGDPLIGNTLDGRSAAQMAAHRGRADILKELARRNIDPRFSSLDALIAACASADRERAEAILANEPQLRQILIAHGGMLLAQFSGVGNTEGVRCLLDLGVAVDALYPGDAYFDIAANSTALHVAAWRAWPGTVKLLLERGAPVNALDGKGRSALQLAVRACVDSYWKNRRTPESIQALLGAGAKTDGIELPTGYAEADDLLTPNLRK